MWYYYTIIINTVILKQYIVYIYRVVVSHISIYACHLFTTYKTNESPTCENKITSGPQSLKGRAADH